MNHALVFKLQVTHVTYVSISLAKASHMSTSNYKKRQGSALLPHILKKRMGIFGTTLMTPARGPFGRTPVLLSVVF